MLINGRDRKPVRVTYAHKRGRALVFDQLPSSSLENLDPDISDVPRREMSRRMLKRSRRAALAEQVQDGTGDPKKHQDRLAKRSKHSDTNIIVTEANIITHDVDFSQFQTPFQSAEYVHPSAVTKALVPEQLSPVPVARKIISRTSSRNLKENSRMSPYPLASPFHSRPGSLTSSPKTRGKESRASRHPLFMKSRTLSSASVGKVTNNQWKETSVSLGPSMKNSPAKNSLHRRHPSGPTPSYMLRYVSQMEWMAPPKALSRPKIARRESAGAFPDLPYDSSFFSDGPQFYSTPHAQRKVSEGSRVGKPEPQTPLNTPESYSRTEAVSPSGINDVEMIDASEEHGRKVLHIQGNSIISSSGDFTLGGAPATVDASSIEFETESNTIHYSNGGADAPNVTNILPINDSASGQALRSNILEKDSVDGNTVPFPPSSPFSAVSTRKNTFTSKVDHECAVPTPPPSPPRLEPSITASPASSLVQDMLSSLDLGDTNGGTESNEEHLHSLGHRDARSTNMLSTCSLPLQSPVDIEMKDSQARNKKGKQPRRRSRAGTIRASDYMHTSTAPIVTTLVSTINGPGGSLPGARRTRSGTVVGPTSSLAMGPAHPVKGAVTVVASKSIKERPGLTPRTEDDSDDELMLLRSPWDADDFEYLGINVHAVDADESDDELLLTSAWKDENWPMLKRPTRAKRV